MFKKTCYKLSAAMTVGMLVGTAGEAKAGVGSTFSTISQNIVTSIEGIPGLLTGMSYLFGILLAVLGVMKIKDHVENPTQTPLKDGAIRLAAGGALFALPIMFDAMFTTIDGGAGGATLAAQLNKVKFNVT